MNISESSKVSVAPVFGSALNPAATIPLMRGPVGAIVNHVTIQSQDQGRLLEEMSRDLEVFKKAYHRAEREIQEREAKFDYEKRVLNDKIQHLEVRLSPYHTFSLRPLRLVLQVSPPQSKKVVNDGQLMLLVPPSIQEIEAREKRVVVLIDGDGAIFLPSLIAEGKKGGHEAASRLTESIKAHLEPAKFQLHVYVFHNRRGLMNTLKRCGYPDAATMFDDFVVGFNQAAERFAMIDAGEIKEGSDHKMRGMQVVPA